MKYLSFLFLCTTMCFSLFSDVQQSGEAICKRVNKFTGWKTAAYTKIADNGAKYLYFIPKPNSHVTIVATKGIVIIPITRDGGYRFFEYFLVDDGSLQWMQREIDFDRWNKLRDCKCELDCPCWKGLDCTCGSCETKKYVPKTAGQDSSK